MRGNLIIGMISLVLLATASYASGASPEDSRAENFTLDIFGNANMDNTIDQKDITYVEGVISGSNAATNLSDANYDGRIDSQDIEQINDIMAGTEKNLTLIDTIGRIVTIAEPVEGIASFYPYSIDVIQMLGESDDISDVKRLRDEILSRPELANVNAVKDNRVYIDDGNMATGIQMPIAIAYYAKLLQPELLSDLDPEAIQQEFLSKYCFLDYNLNEHGIFFYPPLNISGNAEGVPDRIIKG